MIREVFHFFVKNILTATLMGVKWRTLLVDGPQVVFLKGSDDEQEVFGGGV